MWAKISRADPTNPSRLNPNPPITNNSNNGLLKRLWSSVNRNKSNHRHDSNTSENDVITVVVPFAAIPQNLQVCTTKALPPPHTTECTNNPNISNNPNEAHSMSRFALTAFTAFVTNR